MPSAQPQLQTKTGHKPAHASALAAALAHGKTHGQVYSASYSPINNVLQAAQKAAYNQFLAKGFPTPVVEGWRFTNLSPLAQTPFVAPVEGVNTAPSIGAAISSLKLAAEALTLVFVDGVFAPHFSEITALPEGVRFTPLAFTKAEHLALQTLDPLCEEEGLISLNTAFLTGGCHLEVAAHTHVPTPIEVLALNTQGGVAIHPRFNLTLADGAGLTLLYTAASVGIPSAPSWQNDVCTINIGAGAKLHFFSQQKQALNSFYTGHMVANVAEGGFFKLGVTHRGGRLARTWVHTSLTGEGAGADVYAFNLTGQNQHHNLTTQTQHLCARTAAAQNVHNIVASGGHSVFMGGYLVQKEAQQTVAEMLNKNLLLGPRAKADYKPQLEIYADDVQCSHGATTGSLDAEALFYLQARGLPPQQAKNLLTHAFITELLENVPAAAVQKVTRDAEEWLATQPTTQGQNHA